MNCGLHSAAEGMEKNALAMTFCCLGHQFMLKLQCVWHSSTQWWCDFVQAAAAHCQSPFPTGHMHRACRTIKGYQLLPSLGISIAEGAVGWFQFWAGGRVWVMQFQKGWSGVTAMVRMGSVVNHSLFCKLLLLILQLLLLVLCLCSSDSKQRTLNFFKISSQRTSAK